LQRHLAGTFMTAEIRTVALAK